MSERRIRGMYSIVVDVIGGHSKSTLLYLHPGATSTVWLSPAGLARATKAFAARLRECGYDVELTLSVSSRKRKR